jgi:hypothetical protein
MNKFHVILSSSLMLIIVSVGGAWLYGQQTAAPADQAYYAQQNSKIDLRGAPIPAVAQVQTGVRPAATAPTPTVGAPTTTTAYIVVQTPTTVTVTAQISPVPLAGSVNLLRLPATGTQATILGVMHDDGKNGDAVAGDGIYTLQVPFNEPIAGQIQLQVSAAFQGILKRSTSAISTLPVWESYVETGSPVSFAYPSILGVQSQVILNNGRVSLSIPTGSGTNESAVSISLISAGGISLSDWFAQNVDPSGELLGSTYTLANLPDGGSVLLLTGGVPTDWNNGPLAQAYAMSADGATVAIVQISQDDPLQSAGLSADQISAIVNGMASSIHIR